MSYIEEFMMESAPIVRPAADFEVRLRGVDATAFEALQIMLTLGVVVGVSFVLTLL